MDGGSGRRLSRFDGLLRAPTVLINMSSWSSPTVLNRQLFTFLARLCIVELLGWAGQLWPPLPLCRNFPLRSKKEGLTWHDNLPGLTKRYIALNRALSEHLEVVINDHRLIQVPYLPAYPYLSVQFPGSRLRILPQHLLPVHWGWLSQRKAMTQLGWCCRYVPDVPQMM